MTLTDSHFPRRSCPPAFVTGWNAGHTQLVTRRVVSDRETPISAFLKLGHGRPFSFLLESMDSNTVRGRYSILGRDPDVVWQCRDGVASVATLDPTRPDSALSATPVFAPVSIPPLEDLRQRLQACTLHTDDPLVRAVPMAAGFFGAFGYGMVRQCEKLPMPTNAGLDIPDALLTRPRVLVIFDQLEMTMTLVAPAWHDAIRSAEEAWHQAHATLEAAFADLRRSPLPSDTVDDPLLEAQTIPTTSPQRMTSSEAFQDKVRRAQEYIKAGDIFQVVLSQRFVVPMTAPPMAFYRVLRRLDPSPFMFFFNFGTFDVVGSSPEILVRVRDGRVTIRPIAGTRPRGLGGRSDDDLSAELLADQKELAEHLMLLDLGRNDVGRVAKTGTVQVTARNTIETYRHVLHIVSNVEGMLDDDKTTLDALMAGFPAGTVSGAPKIRAMEIIAELEGERRALYGGGIGYFGAQGTLDTCLAIRTGVIKDGLLHVQAGAGVVHDSVPEAEDRECAAKARSLLRAAEIVAHVQEARDG